MVGVDKINKWATALGLGVKSGIDLPNEVQGLVPSTEWKRRVKKEKWYAGETISVGNRPGRRVRSRRSRWRSTWRRWPTAARG